MAWGVLCEQSHGANFLGMEHSDCAGGKDTQSLLNSYFSAEFAIYLAYKICGYLAFVVVCLPLHICGRCFDQFQLGKAQHESSLAPSKARLMPQTARLPGV